MPTATDIEYQADGRTMTGRDAMMTRLDDLWHDPERTRGLARAGLEILLAEPRADAGRVAAIGYCFGGHLVLELARDGADLAAGVDRRTNLYGPVRRDGQLRYRPSSTTQTTRQ